MRSFNFLCKSALALALGLMNSPSASACTGIRLSAKDGSKIIARTLEWGSFEMPSQLFVMPRGYTKHAIMPDGSNGLTYKSKYGYVGIGVHKQNYVTEAVNEKGLTVESFFFPGYGHSETYDISKKDFSITDAEILSWIVGSFATVEETLKNLDKVRMVELGRGSASPHFSIMDASGRQVVLEYYDNKWHIFENKVGVVTNAPGFDWHVTNLNNYINVLGGTTKPRKLNDDVTLKSFGVGSAGLGLPGDLTPPSRFVRAAFFVNTAKPTDNGEETIMQSFHILNNFDIPVGAEFSVEERDEMPNMPSATQWTSATDTKALKFYYTTQWNNTVRCIDLNKIDFNNTQYKTMPLDVVREQKIEKISFN